MRLSGPVEPLGSPRDSFGQPESGSPTPEQIAPVTLLTTPKGMAQRRPRVIDDPERTLLWTSPAKLRPRGRFALCRYTADQRAGQLVEGLKYHHLVSLEIVLGKP